MNKNFPIVSYARAKMAGIVNKAYSIKLSTCDEVH